MRILEAIINVLTRALIGVAGGALGIMILLTCGNIFLRMVWMPIKGTFELMGYLGAITMAFALAYTQIKKGHIAVDVLVLGFSKRTRRILQAVNNFICALFFALVAWQIAKYATTLWRTGEVTETLRIIYYPFTYGVALGCAALFMVFLRDLLKSLTEHEEDEA